MFCYHASWLGVHSGGASGPVQTNSSSPLSLGATVGSNNTGELTAWLEAALYLITLDQPPSKVIFKFDSKWAAGVVRGTNRPKKHKTLVKHARMALWSLEQKTTVQWEWVKGHSGDEFNERADQLAESGKNTGEWIGGRQSMPRMATPHSLHLPVLSTQTSVSEKYANFLNAVQRAQSEAIPTLLAHPKQPWITPDLALEMERVRQLRVRCSPDYPAKYKALKKQARSLKKQWTRDRLTEDSDTKHTKIWRVARQLKRGFQARRTRLKKDGKPVPWTKTHEFFAEQLTNVQWGPTTVEDEEIKLLDESPPLHPPSTTPPEEFSYEELMDVLRGLKKSKAPGLDGMRSEAIVLLDYVGERLLLDLLNECFKTKTVPQEWKQALVVNIYKGKGSESDPANYRPISLLNVLYKIYAALLQKRLAAAHDHSIRPTQFGFRAKKSTSDPTFILRRLQDYSAKTGQPVHVLFLDWKQAFDKVNHQVLLIALRRLGVHPHYLDILKDLYTSPEFCTQGYSADKQWGKVYTGIRQGCPLSPYLFIMLMTVLFHDVDNKLRSTGTPQNTWSVGKPVYDLEYADDTALMALSLEQLEAFLHAVQVEATLYGLELNKDKTELLRHPDCNATISFANGDPVNTTTTAKYLGSHISWTTPPKIAIKFRKEKAEAAFSKLHHVWCSRLPWKAKSTIFHSSIVPVYTFGLDLCSLDKQHFKTIEAWYFRHLRRALSIKASYYSRVSNQRVWKAAGKRPIPSQTILQQQFKMLIKSTTTPPADPLHHVMFSPGYKDRIKFTKSKSRGHPARYWYDLVSQETIRAYHQYLNQHSIRDARKDFLGLKQRIHTDAKFGEYLTTAPTRTPQCFPLYRKTVGSAWQA